MFLKVLNIDTFCLGSKTYRLQLQGSSNTVLKIKMSFFLRSVVDVLVKYFIYCRCRVRLSTRSLLYSNLELILDFLMMTSLFTCTVLFKFVFPLLVLLMTLKFLMIKTEMYLHQPRL